MLTRTLMEKAIKAVHDTSYVVRVPFQQPACPSGRTAEFALVDGRSTLSYRSFILEPKAESTDLPRLADALPGGSRCRGTRFDEHILKAQQPLRARALGA